MMLYTVTKLLAKQESFPLLDDRQIAITTHIEFNVLIQKATFKSSADRDSVDLIQCLYPVSGWTVVGSVIKLCATDEDAVEAGEIHKPFTITVTAIKIMLRHQMFKQVVIRVYPGVHTPHHDHNAIFIKPHL